jgi:hypothetical protein
MIASQAGLGCQARAFQRSPVSYRDLLDGF